MTISKFDDLQLWAEAFALGEFSSMVVVGRRGLSKTTTFIKGCEVQLGESMNHPGAPWLYISARLTAFELYRQAYLFRDSPILIDDVDSLLHDRQTVALLKALMQDELPRRVSWYSDSFDDTSDIPKSFTSSSPICILANDIGVVNANLEAVLDRAKVVEFLPSVDQVITQCESWFDDPVILRFVRDWEPFIGNGLITMRQLKHARDYRLSTRVNVDWEADLLQQWNIDTELVAAYKVYADKSLTTKGAKLAAFQEHGGGSVATLYRLLAMLKAGRKVYGASGRKLGKSEAIRG